MADQFITELDAITTIAETDLIVVEHDPSGTPETNKITWADAKAAALAYLPDSIRTKYIITPSVTSNNLKIAIKYIDGNDCTSTNKITFRIGNTEYTLSAAVSFTKNAGTNWCSSGSAVLAANDVDYFVYAIGETGASAGLKFGFSRIPYAKTMSDFVNTTTNEKYIAGNWTNFNSTDEVINIGRFRARLSASASFNWSIPTSRVLNYPILQTSVMTWTPTITYSGGTTNPTSNTVSVSSYQINGRSILFHLESALVRGSGNRANTFFDLPWGTFVGGTSPSNGLTSFTAAGLHVATVYLSAPQIVYYNETMVADGSYYATVSHTMN